MLLSLLRIPCSVLLFLHFFSLLCDFNFAVNVLILETYILVVDLILLLVRLIISPNASSYKSWSLLVATNVAMASERIRLSHICGSVVLAWLAV